MRVVITLDRFDGSRSQGKELYLDGSGFTQLAFMLAEKSVAGATITKADVLNGIKQMESEDEES